MSCTIRFLFKATILVVIGISVHLCIRSLGPRALRAAADGGMMDEPVEQQHHSTETPVYLEREKETAYPIIVWWTPFTPYKREVKTCRLGKCVFTQSRTEYENPLTEGFMFYGTGIEWKDLPLPREHNHKWFLLHEESPKNDLKLSSKHGITLFNLTATFSRHSSYTLVTQFLESVEWLLNPIIVPTKHKSKGDIGLVMFLHSDCDVPSDRDSYARELMKYVQVDSYGKCVHNKDLPVHLRDPVTGMDSPDLIKIQGKYKFVLAMENAIADDYITEKLWRTFRAGSVPVYKGSPSVLDWAPSEHSIILTDNYRSPEELANYLKYLDRNDDEYNKYLSYKTTGVTNRRLLDHMKNRDYEINYSTMTTHDMIDGFQCFTCDKMHERRSKARKGEPLPPLLVDGTHYNTYLPKPAMDVSKYSSSIYSYPGYNSLLNWKYFYACGDEQAKHVKQAISKKATQKDLKKILSKPCERSSEELL